MSRGRGVCLSAKLRVDGQYIRVDGKAYNNSIFELARSVVGSFESELRFEMHRLSDTAEVLVEWAYSIPLHSNAWR